MLLHTHARMPAASMPAVAWVRERTRAKPLLPPAAMPAAALPAVTLHAGMCMQMHVYMCVYMEYYGVLKGTMGFSPNFDFSFDVLVQKPSRMVWEGPRSLSTKQISLLLYICPYLFYMFITIAYWTHGLVLL